MAIWFLRFAAASCLATTLGALGLAGRDYYQLAAHEAAIGTARQRVEELGGSFSIDHVAGNYVIKLQGPEITDAKLEELVVCLRALPTGPSQQSRHYQRRFGFNLAETQTGDSGVRAISTLPLMWLNLNNTQITDEAFVHLQGQDRLSLVLVTNTRATRPAIIDLQRKLPQLWIPVSQRVASSRR